MMFNATSFIEEAAQKMKDEIDQIAIIACSGGVDSTVAAVIANQAIGDRLHCVYVDTGLMRKNETEEIQEMLAAHGLNLTTVFAEDRYFEALDGVTEPEQKRKVIGEQFIRVFEEEQVSSGAKYLVQGTIAPDWIESGGGERDVIKSHHNVGGLPKKLNFKLIEPLKELFKDEVRILGKKLNIPGSILKRHPFPGPGLAVRIPGNITREKIKILQNADEIFIEQLKKKKLYNKIWQAFTVLLPVKTIGVMGDQRSYEYTCVLRAVTSVDGMTAEPYYFNSEDLAQISTKIVNEVKGVNRVVYDYTSKPPGTIEWE